MREGLMGSNIDISIVHPGHIQSRQTEQHIGPMPGLMSADDAAKYVVRSIKEKRLI
ncbi:hypothetical protein [Cognatishimia activa]|uniref:hypothetical protein n=1 Tax=Cognatishimia activa TaxID=1715691 RepID=UPI000AD6CD07|nr:hypothetical protein [Cognatishimia activa]